MSVKLKTIARRLNNSHDQVISTSDEKQESNDAFSRNEVVSVRETLKMENPSKMFYQPKYGKVSIDKENSDMKVEVLCLQKEKIQKDKEISRLLAENEHLFQIAVVQNDKFKKLRIKQMNEQQIENGLLTSQLREAKEQLAQSDRLIQSQKNQLNNFIDDSSQIIELQQNTQPKNRSQTTTCNRFHEEQTHYDDDKKLMNYQDLVTANTLLKSQHYSAQETIKKLEYRILQPDQDLISILRKRIQTLELQLSEVDEKFNQVNIQSSSSTILQQRQIQTLEQQLSKVNDQLCQTSSSRDIFMKDYNKAKIQNEQLQLDTLQSKIVLNKLNEKIIQNKINIQEIKEGVGREITYDIDDGAIKCISFQPLLQRKFQESKLKVKSQLDKKSKIQYMDCYFNSKFQMVKVLISSIDGQIIGYPDISPSSDTNLRIQMENTDVEILTMEFLPDRYIREYRLSKCYIEQITDVQRQNLKQGQEKTNSNHKIINQSNQNQQSLESTNFIKDNYNQQKKSHTVINYGDQNQQKSNNSILNEENENYYKSNEISQANEVQLKSENKINSKDNQNQHKKHYSIQVNEDLQMQNNQKKLDQMIGSSIIQDHQNIINMEDTKQQIPGSSTISKENQQFQVKNMLNVTEQYKSEHLNQLITPQNEFMSQFADNLINISDLQFIRGCLQTIRNLKLIVSITLRGLIVFSTSSFVYGIQGIYMIKNSKSIKKGQLMGGIMMNSSPCLACRDYQKPKGDLTLISQSKVLNLEEQELEYISIHKDENGTIRNIAIKQKNQKQMINYGSSLKIEELHQSKVIFRMNQYLACDFKFSQDSENVSDFHLTNIKAIDI